MPDVISLGEALIDIFVAKNGVSLKEANSFISAPGGAPANVAVALARLGIEVGLIGRVGDDPFGIRLLELFQSEGVDTTNFLQIVGYPTTIALVASPSPNKQDFVLYRGADAMLKPKDLNRSYIVSAKVLLFGSVTLTANSRDAAFQAVNWAKEGGVLVAYDANLRPALWRSLKAAREGILAGMEGVSICKVNEIELELLTGTPDLSDGSRKILDHGVKLCLVTLGHKGAYFNNGWVEGHVPGFRIPVVDTTGCGDSFFAGLIVGFLETSLSLDELDSPTLFRLVRFANAVAALASEKKGAMEGLPFRSDVENFLNRF